MTIDELVRSVETELAATDEKIEAARDEIRGLIDLAKRERRGELTSAEDARTNALFKDIDRYAASRKRHEARLTRAREVAADEDRLDAQSRIVHDTPAAKRMANAAARVERISVGRSERQYHQGNDPHGVGFVMDVCRSFLNNDHQANDRLSRHMAEERVERGGYLERAVGTGAFAGLTVPQYLTDMAAPAIAARRPFADGACTRLPLPDAGMSVNISRVTTASSAALQATENSAVSNTDMDDTLLTVNVQTAAGQQTISRQAVDRGTGIDQMVLSDLMARYATVLDSTLLNQATTGMSAVAVSNAYADATPTGAELYPKLLGAAQGVETALLGGPADRAVMHSRRWAWLSKEMTTSWPLINSQGIPTQASGVNLNAGYGDGIRGVLPNGMRVVVDNNITTTAGAGTEDEIYIVPSQECLLWEDQSGAPAYIRAETPAAANLGVLLVVYGYFAYTFGRYSNAMQKINGTGLIAPTF